MKAGQLAPSWAGDEAMELIQAANERPDTDWLKQKGFRFGLEGSCESAFLSSCFVLRSLPCLVLSQASHCGQAPSPSSAVTSWQALGKEEESFSRAARSMSLPTFDSDWLLCPSLKHP